MKKQDLFLLLCRISTAFPMLFYGINKAAYGFNWIETSLQNLGLPSFLAYGVLVGEILSPMAMLIGFRTKVAAFIFFLNTIAAFLIARTEELFTLNQFGGWSLDLLFMFMMGGLMLSLSGAGKYSLSNNHKWD